MKKNNGAQTVEVISKRNIVMSSAVGKTNLDELVWLSETVLKEAHMWKSKGWAYIADCSEMKPILPSEGKQLVVMTKAFVDAGCKAFAFVDGNSLMLKAQAQKNTERSETGVTEGHFATLDEALEWLDKEIGI